MQSQQRTPTSFVPAASKKSPIAAERRVDERRAPIELDARALRQVAGGTDLPKKVW